MNHSCCAFAKAEAQLVGSSRRFTQGIKAAAILALLACFSACSCSLADGKQRQLASARTVNFGNVAVGMSSTQTLPVSNIGQQNVTILSATVSGGGFSFGGPTLPLTLLPGQSASFNITFVPSAPGPITGSFSLSSSWRGSSTVSLSGTGSQPSISVAPTNVSFGYVTVGATSAQTVAVRNTGNAELNITQIVGPASAFSASGPAMPLTLSPGQAANFSLIFRPSTTGSITSSLTFVSNAPTSTMAVSVSGTGGQSSFPQVSVVPASLAFGNVTVGNNGRQSVTISNGGNASLSITAANVTGPGFSVGGLSSPMTIGAGGSATVTVNFAPSSTGSASGSLSLTNNAMTSPATVALSGTGMTATPELTADPTTLSFGNVNVGSASSQNVTLTNSGTSNVTISQVTTSGAGFTASNPAQTLTAGQSVTLAVNFAPTSTGSVTGGVVIGSNATNAPTNISVSGSGVQQSSGTSDPSIPSTFFGMHVAVSATSYSTPILPPLLVGATGKGVVTNWPYIEQSRGDFSWSALDQVVAFAVDHSIPIFEGHQWEPSWSVSETSSCFTGAISVLQCPTAPLDLTTSAPCQGVLTGTTTTDCQWKEFLTAMVQRYKTTGIQAGCTSANPQCHGVIQMYEGWNEPGGWSLTTAQFVTLETDFLNTVRANDPGAQVCSPAFIIDPVYPSYATLMADFFANGGPTTFDCYDFHINEATPEAQITDISTFKSVLSGNGITDPLVYATEAGRWGGCNKSPVSISEQAYIARIELLYWSNGVKRHYWYAYDSCAPLTNQPGSSTLNAAGIAYGTVEGWMVGATLSTPCSANGTVWTCGLTRPNGYQALAVWDTSGTNTFSVPSQYTEYFDLGGGTHQVNGSVTIGTEPILLTNGVSP